MALCIRRTRTANADADACNVARVTGNTCNITRNTCNITSRVRLRVRRPRPRPPNTQSLNSYDCVNNITVELVYHCIRNMRRGKACGPDTRPSVVLHLRTRFQMILKHGFVPGSFAYGVSIPLIKDKTGNLNDTDKYRAITLSPVISKLFEMVVLEICNDAMTTDLLQFGFKSNVVPAVLMPFSH